MNASVAIREESEERDERRWLAEARGGDADAFRHLVDAYRDRVFTFLLRMVKQREEAEDLAQEAFVRAWRFLARYDDRWAFRTWLFSIARNLAINSLKRPRATILSIDGSDEPGSRPIDVAAAGASPAEEAVRREQKRQLSQALETLPPRSAMIFTLFYQEEMSIAEIAQTVGMSPGAVKVALYRTREALRTRLK